MFGLIDVDVNFCVLIEGIFFYIKHWLYHFFYNLCVKIYSAFCTTYMIGQWEGQLVKIEKTKYYFLYEVELQIS